VASNGSGPRLPGGLSAAAGLTGTVALAQDIRLAPAAVVMLPNFLLQAMIAGFNESIIENLDRGPPAHTGRRPPGWDPAGPPSGRDCLWAPARVLRNHWHESEAAHCHVARLVSFSGYGLTRLKQQVSSLSPCGLGEHPAGSSGWLRHSSHSDRAS
jgi:hypothetical protein